MRAANRRRIQGFMLQYKKKNNRCSDCRQKWPSYVLEFDHRQAEEKVANVADMVSNQCSIENIKKEIAKCDLLCANCHRIRTFSRQRKNPEPGKV